VFRLARPLSTTSTSKREEKPLAALPGLADRGRVLDKAMRRIKEEAKVEAIFTTISKSWSMHPSYLEVDSCSMLGRDDISVIQNVRTAASIPLHGFSVADEATAALNSIEIRAWATPRQPLLVAVRGAGGGKSRAIGLLVVELNKRALSASTGDPLADPGVLGIAITFNHNWTTFLAKHCGIAKDHPEHHMAIEVASRVLSVLYGEDMEVVQTAMKEHASIFLDAPSKDVVRAVPLVEAGVGLLPERSVYLSSGSGELWVSGVSSARFRRLSFGCAESHRLPFGRERGCAGQAYHRGSDRSSPCVPGHE
jgi:hypothetical protein